MNEIGNKLKEKREENGVSVEEAALDLKLRPNQIISLESGNKEDFKDVIALKKLIGDYAKYLGLDAEKLLDEFNEFLFDFTSRIPIETIEEAKNKKEVKEVVSPYTSMSPKKNNWKMVVVVGIVMTIIIGICLFIMNKVSNDTSSDITYTIGGVR